MKRLSLVVLSILTATNLLAKPPRYQGTVLKTGTYQGTAKALTCEGCADFIQQTLSKLPAIEAVSVDQKTKTVTFSVKKDAEIKYSDLQGELKKASDQMGMGANYQLEKIEKVKPKA